MSDNNLELCNFDTLDVQLRETASPVPTLKAAIKTASEKLNEHFWQGENVQLLVQARSDFIDQILIRMWNNHIKSEQNIALVAVGGYGRGELHPSSDIDILILLRDDGALDKGAIEAFVTALWDLGLDVGHSVRDLSECVSEGRKDITIATNLMESRCITGDEALFDELSELSSPQHIWPSLEFFQEKWNEQRARHQKFYDSAYNLEPNIKESPGGLRDIQMIGWVNKRHFGADHLYELVNENVLNEDEYQSLIEGQAFLWRIRFALHALTGRREDRLLFEHQRTLAEKLGFEDEQPGLDEGDAQRAADGRRLGVELFMKKYFRTVTEIGRLNIMLLQLYQEVILYADEDDDPKPINRRFQSRRGFLEVVSNDVFTRYPYALLELFLLMAQYPELKGVRATTIRLVRQHQHLIDSQFRKDIRCRALFMEIMRQPRGVTQVLRYMNQFGVLAAYLPEFDNIVGQMQYDLFHVYTVDQHTLFVVRNLRRFTVKKYAEEFPLCSRVSRQLPKPELLYIAGLFHDIGKGRGGDHSVLGARDVETFCKRHDLSQADTELVSWLVRNHLLMSMTAQHKDIDDPEVINDFASKVENRIKLDYLYLLTVADMRGTNPKLWNSWKDALLSELYKQTHNAFLRGLENPIDRSGLIKETKSLALKRLDTKKLDQEDVKALWENMYQDYFLRYNTGEILRHAELITLEFSRNESECLIHTEASSERGSTDIFIHAPIKPYIFAMVTGTLDQLGLNIVEARLVPTKDGYTMDTYSVLEYNNDPITDPHRLAEINERLNETLKNMKLPEVCKIIGAERRIEHFSIPPKVTFSDDKVNNRTIMEVVATDRTGLLSRIAKAITDSDVFIQNAKISTIGAQAEDVFFISDENHQPISHLERREEIRQLVISYLEKDSEQ